ncbi:MAG: hypothetical protein LAO56_05580 [Acidobacteriia bacterium]|nr:hypothetical protein [Terriglobia bacterium]
MNISRPNRNFAVAASIGVVSGTLCWAFLHRFQLGGADFNWAHRAARALLSGENPYANTPAGTVPYPLPAAIAALPFAAFPVEFAGALFFGISSGLLALGLIRQSPQRLLVFLAYPYWAALMTAQWAPLVMCAAFFPLALAFCIAKPQVGTSVALTYFSRKGVIAGAALLLASFVLQPRWPMEWIPQLRGYQYFVPLLVLPGPLLALALWRWRDRDARLLFLACVLPQRWFYDSFILWLIPKTRRSILATVACSWVVGLWRWYHIPHTKQQVGVWCVLGFYVPMLVVVLLRARHEAGTDSGERSRSSFQKSQVSTTTGQQN